MCASNSLFQHKSLIFFAALLFIFTHALVGAATTIANKGFGLGNLSGRLCSGNYPIALASIIGSRKYSDNFALIKQIGMGFRTKVTLRKGGLSVAI